MDCCVICLNNKNTKDNKFVLNPSLDAFKKLVTKFFGRTKRVTARELFDKDAQQYHGIRV